MTSLIRLGDVAHARSGDKGDHANVGVIAFAAEDYEFLRRALTAERVKAFFGDICRGPVERYEMPNVRALNFVLRSALGGGASASLRIDSQGKTFATAILEMRLPGPGPLAGKG